MTGFQRFLSKISLSRLLISVVNLFILTFISFFIVFAYEETGPVENYFIYVLVTIFKWFFLLISFPAFYIVQAFHISNTYINLSAILLDCIIFGMIIEIVFTIFKSDKFVNTD